MLNRGYAYASTVPKHGLGRLLLAYLAEVYSHSTVDEWRERLSCGEVTLDGHMAAGDETLRAGQAIVWDRPPWEEPAAPRQFNVLFDDEYLVAVDKPGGLPTLPGGGYLENSLLRAVQERFPEANPVHRLGRATTGVVLFAKTKGVAAKLAAEWNTARVRKIYCAMAAGVAAEDRYDIVEPIGLVPHARLAFVWAARAGGKPSRSVAEVVRRGRGTTLFRVNLFSGRPHQIRIHLASIGHPLAGDPLYGPGGLPLADPGLPGDGGYLLHAQFLQFDHPVTERRVCLEAVLPEGFAVGCGSGASPDILGR